jgi:hypothetical protein
MRGVPVLGPVTLSRLLALGVTLTAWPWCWRARQRDTAGTAGGRSPGVPCAARRRVRRAYVRRTRAKRAARNGESPG